MEITRELDKESPIHSYTIYTIDTWSVLSINNATLKYICHPQVHHTITIRQIYCNHTFDIIVPVPSIMFQTYDIISCDASCDCGHVPLHHPKENKRKIRLRKIDKKKRKSK